MCHLCSLRGHWWFLRWVLVVFDIMDFPKDTSRKLNINFQISAFQESGPTLWFSKASSIESKRTLVVPERSLGGLWHIGCPKNISNNLQINFQISSFLEIGPTPWFSKASSTWHPWSLRGFWWFLRGVLMIFDMMNIHYLHHMHQLLDKCSIMSNFQIPICLENNKSCILSLLGLSWKLRGLSWLLVDLNFFFMIPLTFQKDILWFLVTFIKKISKNLNSPPSGPCTTTVQQPRNIGSQVFPHIWKNHQMHNFCQNKPYFDSIYA